jgi:hypothetical protein
VRSFLACGQSCGVEGHIQTLFGEEAKRATLKAPLFA